jgi:hypothetical protein
MLLLVIFSMPCWAQETLAYHFVGEPTSEPRVAECPKLEKAPAPTPFVKTGDVLRDLTPSVRASGLPIRDGWVLWNETRRWLIVHGAMSEQWWIASKLGFDGQEDKSKITLDWFRTVDSEHPPKVQDVPLATLQAECLTGGYGATAERVIKLNDGDWSFELDARQVYSSYGVSRLSLSSGARGPGGDRRPEGYITTSIRQEDGKPQIVASWYAGQKDSAWWLRLTTDVVLSDGTSRRNARFRQVGDAYVSWPSESPDQKCRTIPEKYRGQVSVGNELQMIHYLTMDKSAKDANDDVFNGKVDVGEVIRKNAIKNLPQAKLPDWLKEIAAPPLLDLRQAISEYKIELGPDDFIAFDPVTFVVIRASTNADTLESLDMIFVGLCGGMGNDVKYQTWLEDSAIPDVPLTKISIISETCRISTIDWNDPTTSTKIFLNQEFMPAVEGKLEVRNQFEGKARNPNGKVFEWDEQTISTLESDKVDVQDWKKLPNDQVIKKYQQVYISPER